MIILLFVVRKWSFYCVFESVSVDRILGKKKMICALGEKSERGPVRDIRFKLICKFTESVFVFWLIWLMCATMSCM